MARGGRGRHPPPSFNLFICARSSLVPADLTVGEAREVFREGAEKNSITLARVCGIQRLCRKSSRQLYIKKKYKKALSVLRMHVCACTPRSPLCVRRARRDDSTFELVHVASSDIRFPLIYRLERVPREYISRTHAHTIVDQFYPWDLFSSSPPRSRGATSRTASVFGNE